MQTMEPQFSVKGRSFLGILKEAGLGSAQREAVCFLAGTALLVVPQMG